MNPLELPKLTKHVNDFSWVFSREQIETLSQVFAEHEAKTTEQVVTVFFPHREGHELLDIGMNVFNENGIGQKDLNNGLLLIVSTKEKKLRIIVGKGLELKYTEMVCRTIVEEHLRPLLDAGDYEGMVRKWGEITIQSRDQSPGVKKSIVKKSISILVHATGFMGYILLLLNWYASFIFLILALCMFLLGLLSIFTQSHLGYLMKVCFLIVITQFLLLLLPIIIPPTCTNTLVNSDYTKQNCSYTLLGYSSRSIEHTTYTDSYRSSHPEQFSSSDSDWWSSSSDFDWGGGSSNGGGYGD